MMRTNPTDFVPFLEDWKSRFETENTKIYATVANSRMSTNEGAPAVQELIDFLKAQSPLQPLEWSPGLASAALALAKP